MISERDEQWREVVGYEGLYEVSDLGRVRSLSYQNTGKVRVLRPQNDTKGYKQLILSKGGKQKRWFIHRLVAIAFIPNPDNLPHINHKDEDPTNNCVTNLEWCTPKYNNNYGTHNEKLSKAQKGKIISYDTRLKISEANKGKIRTEETKRKISDANKGKIRTEEMRKKNSIPVAQYTKDGILIQVYFGAQEAERQTGIAHQDIAKCCKGKLKSRGGFIWQYAS